MNDLVVVDAIFPTVGNVVAIPAVTNTETPNSDWPIDRLLDYAKDHDKKCVGLGGKMAVHRYREGHALTCPQENPSWRVGEFSEAVWYLPFQ